MKTFLLSLILSVSLLFSGCSDSPSVNTSRFSVTEEYMQASASPTKLKRIYTMQDAKTGKTFIVVSTNNGTAISELPTPAPETK